MIDLLGEHRLHDADVVRHLGGVGQEVRDELTALPVLPELGEVTLHLELLALELRDGLALGEGLRHGLAVQFIELRLVVEGLEVGGSAGHAKEDHALDTLLMMRESGQATVGGVDPGPQRVLAEEGEEGRGAEADSCLSEEGATVDPVCDAVVGGHFMNCEMSW